MFVLYYVELLTLNIPTMIKLKVIYYFLQADVLFHLSPVSNFQGNASQRARQEVSKHNRNRTLTHHTLSVNISA